MSVIILWANNKQETPHWGCPTPFEDDERPFGMIRDSLYTSRLDSL